MYYLLGARCSCRVSRVSWFTDIYTYLFGKWWLLCYDFDSSLWLQWCGQESWSLSSRKCDYERQGLHRWTILVMIDREFGHLTTNTCVVYLLGVFIYRRIIGPVASTVVLMLRKLSGPLTQAANWCSSWSGEWGGVVRSLFFYVILLFHPVVIV